MTFPKKAQLEYNPAFSETIQASSCLHLHIRVQTYTYAFTDKTHFLKYNSVYGSTWNDKQTKGYK